MIAPRARPPTRLCAAWLVLGAACASRAPAAAISHRAPPEAAAAAPREPTAEDAAWAPDEATAYARARARGRGVMVEFWAAWAVPCDELAQTLRQGAPREELARSFVPVRIDVSEDSDTAAEQRARYGATTLPALVFLAPDGRVAGRVAQVLDAPQLTAVIRDAAAALRGAPGSAPP